MWVKGSEEGGAYPVGENKPVCTLDLGIYFVNLSI